MDQFFSRSVSSDLRVGQKRPKVSNLNQMQNRRRYVNFENSSHFICNLNLNNPESTVFIAFKMTNIASGDQEIVNSLIVITIKNLYKVHTVLQNI